jgi:hypothetical protein
LIPIKSRARCANPGSLAPARQWTAANPAAGQCYVTAGVVPPISKSIVEVIPLWQRRFQQITAKKLVAELVHPVQRQSWLLRQSGEMKFCAPLSVARWARGNT